MCTAITYQTKDHYFGRNLDVPFSYQEVVIITPRGFPLYFRQVKQLETHYAMVGIGIVQNNYPLYYDATNEEGLSMAGLKFDKEACYKPEAVEMYNVASFEFIPWLLGQCATVQEAKKLLERANLTDLNFSDQLPHEPLHWLISDRECSITVEAVEDGLKVYDNPVGVLTNSPPFHFQITFLNNFMGLTSQTPTNRFSPSLNLQPYSLGMGAMGLPGDLSSTSRFIKAAFTKMNSISGDTELESISQFFHILSSVAQQRGCVQVEKSEYEYTLYSSCCNIDKGVYYYKTYENSQISGVNMYRENLDSCKLITYPVFKKQQINMQN